MHLTDGHFGKDFINNPADELPSLTVKHSSCPLSLTYGTVLQQKDQEQTTTRGHYDGLYIPPFPVSPLPSTADGRDLRQKSQHKQGSISEQHKSQLSHCLCHCDEQVMGKEGGKRLADYNCCPELHKLQQDASWLSKQKPCGSNVFIGPVSVFSPQTPRHPFSRHIVPSDNVKVC